MQQSLRHAKIRRHRVEAVQVQAVLRKVRTVELLRHRHSKVRGNTPSPKFLAS